MSQELCSWEKIKRKVRSQRWTLALGSEQVKPQTGHLSSGVLHIGDKTPWLLRELLGQIQRLEKPRLHSSEVHGCWLSPRQGRERSALVAAELPHSPVQAERMSQSCSLHTSQH